MVEKVIKLLEERGVSVKDISECVIFLQEPYVKNIRELDVDKIVIAVLSKREVQHAVLTGIGIDKAIEEKGFSNNPISEVIANDDSLFGVDEVLAYGICNLYGSIALTNFGFIDRVKPGIIGKLNDIPRPNCNTFLDDIVGAIAASAASKIAHEAL